MFAKMKLFWIECISFLLVWTLYAASLRAEGSCPISFSSSGKQVENLVVEYGQSISVNCNATNQMKIQWISPVKTAGAWTVKNTTDWNMEPVCRAEFEHHDPCEKQLDFILFKTPKNVSINVQNHSSVGSLVENQNYTLVCMVEDVAPVGNLVVTWYKNGTNDTLRRDTFHNNGVKTPQNVNSSIVITANRSENGAQYFCNAQLELGEVTPKPMRSGTFDVIVFYAPVITKPNDSVVPVFRDYYEVLVCEAEGNPKPNITWEVNNKTVEGGNLTIGMDMVGEVTCWAANKGGRIPKTVRLVFREDYLPVIAGFVAVVVVITSVIFAFIYSIYYTNTKMGRYSLQGAKPNPQNGDVAQNGHDNKLPVKKLSQQNIYALGVLP